MISHRNGAPANILLVEDNPGDVRLTQEAFTDAAINNDLHVVRNGQDALDFLHREGDYADVPLPDLVLLDLNLPKVDGMTVLEEIKSTDGLRRIPVIILTSSEAEEDIVESYENHSNAYLTKPIDPDEFLNLVRSFEQFWLTLVELPPNDD